MSTKARQFLEAALAAALVRDAGGTTISAQQGVRKLGARRAGLAAGRLYSVMRVPWLALALAATGCMMGPTNGQTTSTVVGKTFTFSGKVDGPNIPITIEILENPTLDPANGPWIPFASTTSSPTPDATQAWNDQTPSYSWTAKGRPVPSTGDQTRWPEGGLARFRAVFVTTNARTPLVTFDAVNFDCVTDEALSGTEWNVAGDKCEGMGKRTAVMVHTPAVAPVPVKDPPTGFLTDKGIGVNIATLAYYDLIDAPPTLGAFRGQYNLLTPQASARYYNDADLGLGREMNCSEFTNPVFGYGVACYVRNFSDTFGQAPDFDEDPNAVLVLTTGANPNDHAAFATVAMVYQPFFQTKFIVYDAAGNLEDEAKLDKAEHNVSIPQNCLACHGIDSTYNKQTLLVEGNAEFLPFDPYAFRFSPNSPWRLVDQQESFRKLNAMVKKTQPPAATNDLIDGMYAPLSVNTPGAIANDTYVPTGWHDASSPNFDGKSLYNGVVKKYCRTCHVSSSNPNLDFLSRADFDASTSAILKAVCKEKKMPHAERTSKKFWQSGARAYLTTGLPVTFEDPLLACKP